MVKNLAKTGVEKEIILWTKFMLENRTTTAKLGNIASEKNIDRGTPQGGILSVDLWNLDMNDMTTRFPENNPTEIFIFADDGADVGVGIDEGTIIENLQNDVKIMENWAKDHGLSFSANKTKAMMITKKRKPVMKNIYINGEPIEWVKTFKYLGVTLDDKLSWKQHIENITKKATMSLAQCRKMIGNNWGLNPKISRWMYTALVRPILSYACPVWINAINKTTNSKKLERIQRRACMATLNAIHSTPTAGMEVMIDLLPITVHLKKEAISSYLRMKENGNWRAVSGESSSHKSHSTILTKLTENLKELNMPTDRALHKTQINTKFQVEIKSREMIEENNIKLSDNDKNIVRVFTDGSKIENKAGYGYIYRGNNIKKQNYEALGEHTTVFQAEIIAIMESARQLLNEEIYDKTIIYHVDSQAALKAVNKYTIQSKITAECKLLLNELNDKCRFLKLTWIPSHVGHLGNEVADRLAKRGSKLKFTGPEPVIPISNKYRKTMIKEWSKKIHQAEWTKRTDCRQTKMMIPKANNTVWRQIKNFTRQKMRKITQILTGHSTLKRHLNIMQIEEDPTCEQCEEEQETVEHFLCHCPAFARIRQETLGKHFIKNSEISTETIKNIYKYIMNTKRFSENWEPP